MIIQTTINFRVSVLEKVNDAAETLGISRSAVITKLLKKVMNEKDFSARMAIAVQYQRLAPVFDPDLDPVRSLSGVETPVPEEDSWHKFHISFQEDEYEMYIDLRKFRKMSVSFIVAYAVAKHLDTILGLPQEDPVLTDNYRFKHYVISSSEMHGVVSWQIFWGLPEKTADLPGCRLI
ncbi:MAG: hypothetical protein GY750_18690 [Lentisphaerae bacterium]|nr:hypothetical protein [Lentisphaerota bacterium]